jgi:glycosyltransferase involved in cell wall biosynthesis
VADARPLTVVQLVPALQGGGAERSTLEIAEALVRGGHRSIVVSAGGRLVAPLVAAGSEHFAMDLARKSPAALRHVVALRRLLKQWRPDIVHARSRLPAWVAELALRAWTGPKPHFVTTVHGLNSPGCWSAVMTRGERVVCVSDTVRNYVRRHYPSVDERKLVVIPRGIDATAFPRGHRPPAEWRARFAHEFPQLAGRPLLLLAARGTRLKGHHDALRALAKLRTRPDPGLLLLGAREAGREAYVAEVEALARELGVANRVAIVAPRGDVRDYYAHADLVLQPSNKAEAFGRVVVEALAIGTPVVGYAHGGVGELLGELYPEGRVARGDVDALAVRIDAVLAERPPVAPFARYRLADMQAATLALYREVARA